jgi:hypothetical protein
MHARCHAVVLAMARSRLLGALAPFALLRPTRRTAAGAAHAAGAPRAAAQAGGPRREGAQSRPEARPPAAGDHRAVRRAWEVLHSPQRSPRPLQRLSSQNHPCGDLDFPPIFCFVSSKFLVHGGLSQYRTCDSTCTAHGEKVVGVVCVCGISGVGYRSRVCVPCVSRLPPVSFLVSCFR